MLCFARDSTIFSPSFPFYEEQEILRKNKRLTRIEGRLDNLEDQMVKIRDRLQTDISTILVLLENRASNTANCKNSGLARPIVDGKVVE